jgi:hypothetical protein
MGTCEPSASLWPIAFHVPTERSSEFAFAQPGQLSATVAVTVRPLLVFVIETWRPQSEGV